MPYNRLEPLWRGAGRIAKIDFVVATVLAQVVAIAVLRGEGVHARDACRLRIIRALCGHHLHAQSLV